MNKITSVSIRQSGPDDPKPPKRHSIIGVLGGGLTDAKQGIYSIGGMYRYQAVPWGEGGGISAQLGLIYSGGGQRSQYLGTEVLSGGYYSEVLRRTYRSVSGRNFFEFFGVDLSTPGRVSVEAGGRLGFVYLDSREKLRQVDVYRSQDYDDYSGNYRWHETILSDVSTPISGGEVRSGFFLAPYGALNLGVSKNVWVRAEGSAIAGPVPAKVFRLGARFTL